MLNFKLDSRLQADCHWMAKTDDITYLLHKNAEVLWFILVPGTDRTEFYQLEAALQNHVCQQINAVSVFIQSQFQMDKINVATIGNVVSQMHIHVIGRTHNDIYWPDVVWGRAFEKTYRPAEVESIKQSLNTYLG
jgi:diadenosine tetraphosphate (Ap4A) HIT family hydrolase